MVRKQGHDCYLDYKNSLGGKLSGSIEIEGKKSVSLIYRIVWKLLVIICKFESQDIVLVLSFRAVQAFPL